jgi:DNA repair protein RadC
MITETRYSIQNLPIEERPREKLQRQGGESLSAIELLAVILGSGTKEKPVLQLAQEILMHFESLQKLSDATLQELCQIKGLGPVKALQIKAACALGLKLSKSVIPAKYRIENPLQAYHLVKDQLEREKRELFVIILQDIRGYLINHQVVSIGTLTNALVHPREVFYLAIRHKAASVILAHNHPSGDPAPSPQDLELTKTLVQTGDLLSIPVHDHIIIGHQCYVSMRQRGYPFF